MIIETKDGLDFHIPDHIKNAKLEGNNVLSYTNYYNIQITFYREPRPPVIPRGLGGIISDKDFEALIDYFKLRSYR